MLDSIDREVMAERSMWEEKRVLNRSSAIFILFNFFFFYFTSVLYIGEILFGLGQFTHNLLGQKHRVRLTVKSRARVSSAFRFHFSFTFCYLFYLPHPSPYESVCFDVEILRSSSATFSFVKSLHHNTMQTR